MKNVEKYLQEFYTEKLKITRGAKGDTIHQTQRNAVKAGLMEAFLEDMKEELNIDVIRTADGIAFLIDNDEQGGVPVVLDIAMKNFNYDIFNEGDNYVSEQNRKRIDAEKRAATRRTKFKNDTEARLLNKAK